MTTETGAAARAALTTATPPTEAPREENPFDAMMARYERAVRLLDLEPGIDRILRHPEKEISIAVPIETDDGVTVSYFEWVQNRAAYYWSEAVVNERLAEIMQRSFAEVLRLAQQHRVSMRTAAYTVAVGRVASAHRLRGVYA